MADIVFKRKFEHKPWVDNEDLVQAEGENGFNKRFKDIEGDLDTIGVVVAAIATELQKQVHVSQVAVLSVPLGRDALTNPEEVETYDQPPFSSGLRKVYQVVIEPATGAHPHVSHQFVYAKVGTDQTKVSIWFKNETSVETRVTVKVFALI